MRVGIRSLILGAIAVGLAVAIAVALLVPTRSSGADASPPAAGKITVRPPRGKASVPGAVILRPKRSSVRITQRLDDPRGGPPFALRVFRADRFASTGGTRDQLLLLGHDLCVQLGRIYQGRFGWIDGANVFRPARFDYRDSPVLCGDRWRDDRSHPEMLVTTLITDPSQPRAEGLQSIAWGFGGSRLG